MNREEIEAAAARAGVRITDVTFDDAADEWCAEVGTRYCVFLGKTQALAMVMRTGCFIGRGTLDEAFAAIAADIDEIASVRVERTAEDERADVVAWVVEYRETCEFPDVRDIRDAIKAGFHVGAAGDE